MSLRRTDLPAEGNYFAESRFRPTYDPNVPARDVVSSMLTVVPSKFVVQSLHRQFAIIYQSNSCDLLRRFDVSTPLAFRF